MPPASQTSAPSAAHAFAPRRYGELQKVTERVYLFRNITNSSFVIGTRGVAVIDTQVNTPSALEFLRFIRSVTDKPILYVINTHYHWDHTNGNAIFKAEGAEGVSSKLTREFMVKRAPRQKEFLAGRGFELGKDPLLPETTFEGERLLDLGDLSLRLFFAGKAETDDATAVYVPRENVLMSGDTVMTGSFPIFGQPVWDEGLQGDRQWIETIRRLMDLKPAHVLPGHGPLAHDAEIDKLIRIEEFFLEEVGTRVRKGMPIEQTLGEIEAQLPGWIREMPIVWGTPRYAALRVWRGLTKSPQDPEQGWQRYKPSAISAADASRVEQVTSGKEILSDYLQMASEAKEGGDTALRLSILKKAIQRFQDSPDSFIAYAEALVEESRREPSVLEKGDFFQAARACWDKALRLHPGHTRALLGKGRYLTMMAYRGGDDPQTGMKLLRQVIQTMPATRIQAEAEFYLGMGYRRLGEETKARAQFQKALACNPAFVPARLALDS